MKLIQTLLALAFIFNTLGANDIDSSLKVSKNSHEKLKKYQEKVNSSESMREELLSEYKYISAALKNTKTYNNQLEKIVKSQRGEISSLDEQLVDIEETQKNIFPLMIDMISSLNTLIGKDTPFLLDERKTRVKRLTNTLDRADISTHEKYRIILEAFKIEYDYSKTIETYQEDIEDKTYNILRVGRVGLYYQSLDLKNYGYFNNHTKSWENIDDFTSKSNIKKAIKIAKKQKNVELLNLPFLAAKGQ